MRGSISAIISEERRVKMSWNVMTIEVGSFAPSFEVSNMPHATAAVKRE
jgi:hypothetical protein